MAKSRHLAALLGATLAGMALAFTPSRVSMLGLPATRHRGSLCTSLDRPCLHQGQRNARPGVTTFDMSASGSSRGDMQRRRDVPSRPLPVRLLQGGAGYVAKGLRTLVYAVVVSLLVTALWTGPAEAAASTAVKSVDFVTKFKRNWKLYSTIPIVAGLLNWATNNLAVKMIFYPMEFVGLKLKTWPETPLGLIGWTGIVPVKAKSMATRMVTMVTTSLIDVKAVFRRLSPDKIAEILLPGLDDTMEGIAGDVGAKWALQSPGGYELAQGTVKSFISSFTVKMQEEINSVWDLEGMVVSAMVKDKALLVQLFQECGKKELEFVVNSGLYFGTFLGVLQMLVWVVWDPWWSLALGGAVVGYLTNFFAIKSIFEPVKPVKIGPWKFQGLFLTRQNEVATKFAVFLSERILTSEKIWAEILYGGRKAQFAKLVETHADEFVDQLPGGTLVRMGVGKEKLTSILRDRVLEGLKSQVHRLHPYVDETLELEKEMETKMRLMSSEEFEGVLHPIFEEDELTLIVVGGVLGMTAGFLQAMAPY